jgi:hypothetical protein
MVAQVSNNPYRDGQNVIKDSGTGTITYAPEAKDVQGLMRNLVSWIKRMKRSMPYCRWHCPLPVCNNSPLL